MLILNIIDTLYENSYFSKFLLCSIIVLIVLFIIVLILGIRDKNRALRPKEEVEEDVKDITFNNTPIDIDSLKEDVTFEMPSLTQNLEKFKKNLEEEILNEDMAEVRKTSGIILPKENKKIKVLDREKIEDTNIAPIKDSVAKEKLLENNENSKNEDSSLKNDTTSTNSGKENSSVSFKNPKKHNILEEKLFKHKKNIQDPSIKDKEIINPHYNSNNNNLNNTNQRNNVNNININHNIANDNVNNISKNSNTNNNINKKNATNSNTNINVNNYINQNNDITKKETTNYYKNSFNSEEENIKKHTESEVLGIYNTDDDF